MHILDITATDRTTKDRDLGVASLIPSPSLSPQPSMRNESTGNGLHFSRKAWKLYFPPWEAKRSEGWQ